MPLYRPSLRRTLSSFIFFLASAVLLSAQAAPVTSMITQPLDEANLVVLRGNTHPLALPQYDQGLASGSLALNRVLLVLKRSPAQQSALQQLIDDQQDKSSPNYHRWLTPDQFGQQFGPSDKDVKTVTDWLKSHGLQVTQISRGRTAIEFSGSVDQVQEAFHTSIHNYLVNGQARLSNTSDPQIPAALAPVVAGPMSLNSFPKKSMSHFVGTYSKISGKLQPANPQFTFSGGCDQDNNCYALVPYDFAMIYNVLPLWTSGIDGTGETIAIVGRTNINIQDVRDFRSLFGLPVNDPQIILNGPDPGINGDEPEADIDLQWSGAVAKNATIDFVTSASTETSDGIDLSAEYIVDNNLAPVMSESYGLCELGMGTAGNQFYNALWAQAAAQGVTVFVSTGDSGSAGCDFNQGFAPQPAQFGLAVNGIASTPYNVAIGGTDFSDYFNPTTYWNTFNDPTTQASAKSYIPETTWNDTCTNGILGQVGYSSNAETNCNDPNLLGGVATVGGSGGVSNCTTNTQQLGSCSGGYAKPSWQTGTGVPADGKRDLPDVSLFASNGFVGNFYIVCESDLVGPCSLNTFAGFGGTSVASPAFAGIMALVNQQTHARQGNANYVLYKLAAQQPTAFHDVPSGSTIAMPCAAGSPNCTVKTNGHQYGVLSGYATTTGYDLATGLGSVNVATLVNQWSSVTFKPSTTTLSLSPTTITHGQAATLNGTVAPASGSGTPSGTVSLLTSSGKSVQDFTLSGGAFSGSTKALPGGTYTVSAHYGGDPTYGGSDSTPPISVTVSKEASKVVPRMITFDTSGNILNQNATTAAYGSPYILRMDATDAAGDVCGTTLGCPTGSLALTDNGSPLDGGTFGLNNLGYAEDDFIQLSGGSHSIQAVYAGDTSFTTSTGSDPVTITPAQTTFSPFTLPNSIVVGTAFPVYCSVQAISSGSAPGGTFTFTLNGAPLSGSLTVTFSGGQSTGVATITGNFSAKVSAPGTYTLVGTYTGDSNYGSSSSSSTGNAFYTSSITVVANPPNPQPNANVDLVALVDTSVKNLSPTGTVTFLDADTGVTLPGNTILTPVTDGSGNSALQATLTLVPTHNILRVYAQYSGDSDYLGSISNSTAVQVAGADFSLYPFSPSVTVPKGSTGGVTVIVDGQLGYTGTATFAPCSGLPAESSCEFNPPSVDGTGQTILSIFTTAPHATVRVSMRTGLDWRFTSMGIGLAGICLVGSPRRRKRKRLSFLTIFAVLLLSLSCGGGGSSGGSGGGGGPSDPGTPKGSYTITVTGTSGSLTHSTTFTLNVQ